MMENNPEILQKSKLEVMHLSVNPVLDYICKKYVCMPLFIASLLLMARKWKYPNCPSAYDWINKTAVLMHSGILFSNSKC